MIVEEQEKIGMKSMSFEIVWRNPLAFVQARFRGKEAHHPLTDGQNRLQRFAHAMSAETA